MPEFYKRLLASVMLLCASETDVNSEPHETAILQALDKVTARISTFEAPVGETVLFGNLNIIARACDKRPPEETPESAAFLDIAEIKPGETTKSIYRGWMFASSPALAAMEHPVYDVWVVDCSTPLGTSSSSPAEKPR